MNLTFPGLEAEERGQAEAIARNLLEMARLRTPIIVVIIGEGASGGALWASVLGFNLGVEAGQLSIVACFVPLAFLVRARRWYTRGVVPFGGVALVLLATWWTVERVSSL